MERLWLWFGFERCVEIGYLDSKHLSEGKGKSQKGWKGGGEFVRRWEGEESE